VLLAAVGFEDCAGIEVVGARISLGGRSSSPRQRALSKRNRSGVDALLQS
jgi:hypothetical protein